MLSSVGNKSKIYIAITLSLLLISTASALMVIFVIPTIIAKDDTNQMNQLLTVTPTLEYSQVIPIQSTPAPLIGTYSTEYKFKLTQSQVSNLLKSNAFTACQNATKNSGCIESSWTRNDNDYSATYSQFDSDTSKIVKKTYYLNLNSKTNELYINLLKN